MTSDQVKEVKLYLRKSNGSEHFIECHGESIFTRPTLLCCGGNPCTHNATNKANGFAKKVDAFINTIDINHILKPFQVASTTYADSCMMAESIKAYNNNATPPDMFSEFVNEQIMPLVTTKDGERVDLKVAKKNLRNIQVLAHSFGGIFIQQVGNVLVEKMLEKGYSQNEIDEATSQIVVVTAGSVGNYHRGKANFTTVNILNANDKIVQGYSQNATIREVLASEAQQEDASLIAVRYRYDPESRRFDVDPASNQVVVASNPSELDAPTAYRFNDSKNGYTAPKSNHDAPKEITDETFHESDTYFDYTFAKNGMMLRMAATSVLNNALNNSISNFYDKEKLTPVASVEELLHSPAWPQTKAGKSYSSETRKRTSGYQFDEARDFGKVAAVIGYDERMDDALNARNQYKVIPPLSR